MNLYVVFFANAALGEPNNIFMYIDSLVKIKIKGLQKNRKEGIFPNI